jgi:transposase InsO family protein
VSKQRAVILAVVVEGLAQAEVARRYEVSEATVSRLVARYRTDGDAAFEPRSRRPRRSPTRIDAGTVEVIVNLRKELVDAGLDAGPLTIAWHLQRRHDLSVSAATIRRRLLEFGCITPNPKKRPRSSYMRFAAEVPNECWQSDFFHWRLADGTDTEILTWLDDHARYALSITVGRRVTGKAVTASFRAAAAQHGYPASVLTDNGLVYTTRFAGGRGGRSHLETLLVELGIEQKHSRPNHPTTCGKVERFQQTTQRWLAAQHPAPTLADLQAQLDTWRTIYNDQRPHSSLHRRPPHADRPPASTTASATTASTTPAPSPCAEPDACTTSASAAPTPARPSSPSSTTSTSASSTPPPARSSATSPSTPPATTNPDNDQGPNPHRGFGPCRCLATSHPPPPGR